MAPDAGTFFARLCLCGPLLYIGVSMVVDPAGFATLSSMLAAGLRRFERRLQGLSERHWPQPVGPVRRPAIRMAGVLLILLALLRLTA